MLKEFELKINGKTFRVKAYEDEPLLWVVRERLRLTGTKFGCGIGVCGACTLLINNRAVRSCSIPVSEAVGKDILTIEGIPSSHPLKRAWLQHQVPQCGYCQPGQIMEAYALLLERPRASREEIVRRMSSHLCRCGTYNRIVSAIESVARGR